MRYRRTIFTTLRTRSGSRPSRHRMHFTLAVLCAASLAIAGCGSVSHTTSVGGLQLSDSTPPANGTLNTVSWNLKYEPTSLDPAHGGNYAENEAMVNLCDTLERQRANLSIEPALATSVAQPNPTTYVFTIRSGVKFWNGTPLTTADVVYSMKRNMNPKVGSYYATYYQHVKSITATGPHQVTVDLTQPDALFKEMMATPAGMILDKQYVEAKGSSYGSPSGGVMCSGPFEFKRWVAGSSMTFVRNPHYWDTALEPKIKVLKLYFLTEGSTFASALENGEVEGAYEVPWDAIGRLQSSGTGAMHFGPSSVINAMIISATSGPMTNPLIRRALSLAINREGIIREAFDGAAVPVRAFMGPLTWVSAPSVYRDAWNKLPALTENLTLAKKLVAEAGSPKQQIVFAYASGAAQFVQTIVQEVQQAGQSIGLNVALKGIPVETYQNLFTSAAARKGIDGFNTDWNPDFNDPLTFYINFMKGNYSNYGDYDNALVNRKLSQALRTTNATDRAELVVAAQAEIMRDLPWIPIVGETNALWLNNKITGAPSSFVQLNTPWAASLGATR